MSGIEKFSLPLIILSLLLLSSCGESEARKKGREFFKKIEEQFKVQGEYFKVSDVHSGDWTEICMTPDGISAGDVLDDIRRSRKIKKDDITVINGNKSDTMYSDDRGRWGIYFIYGPNEIEYFSIYETTMARGGTLTTAGRGCIDRKEGAYFKVYQGRKNRNVLALTLGTKERLGIK